MPKSKLRQEIEVPLGTMIPYSSGAVVPDGYLECDGSTLSRTTYADLYTVVGDAWGEGDGSTTFHLPDTRGRFVRGHDDTAGNDTDAGTRTASNTGGNVGDNVGSLQDEKSNYFSEMEGVSGGAATGTVTIPEDGTYSVYHGSSAGADKIRFKNSGDETRPKNVNVKYLIKVS